MKRFLMFCFILCIFLVSCETIDIIDESYISFEEDFSNKDFEYLKNNEEIKLITTDNIELALAETISNRYLIIGKNAFTGPRYTDYDYIKDFGEELGAKIILLQEKYIRTLSSQNGSFNIYGGSTYTKHYDIYEYEIYYLINFNKTFNIGISYTDLLENQHKEIQKNYGVLITIVYKDTPAYYANLFRGDIILKVNDNIIYNSKQLEEILNTIKKPCIFTILRDNRETTIYIE